MKRMISPAGQLAELLVKEMGSVPPETVHPRFETYIAHATLSPRPYLDASGDDHAPLSDLRLRRDESSKDLLHLNLKAVLAFTPDVDSRILDTAWSGGHDEVVASVMQDLGSPDASSSWNPDVRSAIREDPLDVFATIAKYVNIFGSWGDAETVATDFSKWGADLGTDRLRWSISGLAGVVLGLGNLPGHDALFRAAVDNHPDPIEAFFIGLRWASIEAKRNGDLEAARVIIDHASSVSLSRGLDDRDQTVIRGMLQNFKALLAVRSKSFGEAFALVDESVELFGDSAAQTDKIVQEEAVRYSWMAQLNKAQLFLFSGDGPRARDELKNVIAFARIHDRGALHTSLSALAFSYIQDGEPAKALPLLVESLELLKFEYDLKVVVQVRKMLYRACAELDLERSAELVRTDDMYYWRGPNVMERYALVN